MFSSAICRHIILFAVVFKASFANMSFNFTQILQLSNNCWFLWLICHLQFCHILDTFGLSVIYSFVPHRTLLAFCHLQFCHILDTFGLSVIYSFVPDRTLGFYCHLQFCHILDTFGLSVIYSFVPDRTILVYLSFTVFSQIRCIRLTYHLQVLPQIGHICILFI